ncbi:hypothetical protein AtubIFM56815_004914 [Aspergillus tubingensis]|uniref:Uncharacterized protein n=1 Tax=Aspergillus tubingensis TaxID=5068 RepID=A0A9W6AE44_ASPTU|nr:hypothetical protein AtubIFM56815_004914 [Aspergillus tubingensis]
MERRQELCQSLKGQRAVLPNLYSLFPDWTPQLHPEYARSRDESTNPWIKRYSSEAPGSRLHNICGDYVRKVILRKTLYGGEVVYLVSSISSMSSAMRQSIQTYLNTLKNSNMRLTAGTR